MTIDGIRRHLQSKKITARRHEEKLLAARSGERVEQLLQPNWKLLQHRRCDQLMGELQQHRRRDLCCRDLRQPLPGLHAQRDDLVAAAAVTAGHRVLPAQVPDSKHRRWEETPASKHALLDPLQVWPGGPNCNQAAVANTYPHQFLRQQPERFQSNDGEGEPVSKDPGADGFRE